MIRRFIPLFCILILTACSTISVSKSTLSGQWVPVNAEMGGQNFPIAAFRGAHLHLTASTYEFAGDKGNIVILPSTSPAMIDIHGKEGPNAGRTIKAIFDLVDDQLRVCYQLGAGERPTEFKTARGTQQLLIQYQRHK